jgi:RNA polymerase sigma-70 factor (ECF subfamily)
MTNPRGYDQSLELGPASALDDLAAVQPPSLRDLFAMHAPYVWNTLRRLGVPPPDLEDLTHDVFVQVHGHLGAYDPARPVKPWLFGFAYRIASQHRRRAHRRRERHVEPDLIADGAAGPEETAVAEQRRRLVIEALQGIDLQRRAVFVLYELDGVSMSEIAHSLEIPANTAYSRLRVAREEFAAAVKRIQARRRSP